MVKFRKIATQFVVEDVIGTAEYYQNVLGFELLGYFADPPVYAMMSRGTVEMHLGKADDRPQDVSNTGFDVSASTRTSGWTTFTPYTRN